MNLKKISTAVVLITGLTTTATVQAHRAWMVPSATVLSGENAWVTVDGAVSNSLFYFEHHPLNLDELQIRGPAGNKVDAQNNATGKYRSVFDAELTQDGTYTFEIRNQGIFGSYVLDGERKRWRGAAADITDIPDAAQELTLSEIDRRMQMFVTKGAPTRATLKPSGEGLEMSPVTHPNDLFVGEVTQLQFLIDGKPAQGLDVTLIRDGIRYRDQVGEILLTTNPEGMIEVQWQEPGMYWLEVEAERPGKQLENASRRLGYSATLEVLPL